MSGVLVRSKTPLRPKVTDSVFSGAALVPLLGQFGLSKSARCSLWSRGVNHTYRVVDGRKKYMLRVYSAGWRTRQDIAFELDALTFLARHGCKVSTPIPAADGSWIVDAMASEGRRHCALFRFAEGLEHLFGERHVREYGASIARIHAASKAFRTRHKRFALDTDHLIHEPLRRIMTYVGSRTPHAAYLKDVGRRAADRITKLSGDLEMGLCHGDVIGGNAHHNKRGTITIFDFDCCGLGWFAYDIATFRWATNTMSGPAGSDKLWQCFLEGYQQVRTIPPAELSAATDFVIARHLWIMGFIADFANVHGAYRIGPQEVVRFVQLLQNWSARSPRGTG
jgi:Ser/Thr protein kinase RdoA (MazF antagonist)